MKTNAKRMADKLIALLIAVTMIVGLLPVITVADEPAADGYVYLSISYDKEYIYDKNGAPMVYVPVALADIAAVDLTEYGLDNMLYDADGDGEYEITALQLLIYAHEELWGGDWSEVNFDALPGSSYFAGGIFGFTENLVYFLNGDFPVDESMSTEWMTTGATSDRIVLEDGDFLDVASFGCWQFLWDTLGGFHLFADEDGNYVHDYTVEAGEALSVKLMHSFCDLMYGDSWVKETADFEIFYGSVYGEAEGSVMTDEYGNAEITFSEPGTYYVWSEGGIGADDGWTHASCDHYNDTYEPCPVSSPAYAKVTVTGEAAHTCADLDDDHKCDTCDEILSVCADLDDDHKCDICDKTLSVCADLDDDHKCDTCDEILSACTDLDDDHKCDICDKILSVCTDLDDDHKCDICDETLSTCADLDDDHKCDTCDEILSACADLDDDHKCDTCGAILSVCIDTNKDHECDECGATVGEHADGNRKDHLCDWCKAVLSSCNDANKDHNCDICGVTMGEHVAAEGTHACDYCGRIASVCRDADRNGTCDICGSVMNFATYAQETMVDLGNTAITAVKAWDKAIASAPNQLANEINRLNDLLDSAIYGMETFSEGLHAISEDFPNNLFNSLNLW